MMKYYIILTLLLLGCTNHIMYKKDKDLQELADHIEMGCKAGLILDKHITFEQSVEYCQHIRNVYILGNVSEQEFKDHVKKYKEKLK